MALSIESMKNAEVKEDKKVKIKKEQPAEKVDEATKQTVIDDEYVIATDDTGKCFLKKK